MTVAYAGYTSPALIREILTNCRGETVIAENAVDLLVETFAPDKAENLLSAWEKGWIFGKELELRWEKEGEEFHFRYIGGSRSLPVKDFKEINLFNAVERLRTYYLWGERTEERTDEWIDLRIPRLLNYPVSGDSHCKRVVVDVIEYWDRESNQLVLFRFAGLREVKA